jgi:dTDP-N-acetylfucosamine:lipid II N-acetylfucosaminyltransferase
MNTSTVSFVHLFEDAKFIGPARSVYESAMPCVHTYVYLAKSEEDTSCQLEGVLVVARKNRDAFVESEAMQNASYVCLHWVTAEKIRIANALDIYDRIIPFIWGDDIYSNFKQLRRRLWMRETKRVLSQIRRKDLLYAFPSPRKVYRCLRRRMLFLNERFFHEFWGRVKYCIPVIPQDAELLKQVSTGSFTVLEQNYGSIEMVLGDLYPSFSVDGDHVLLGNSATHTNNHIDVLKVLADADLQGSQVYTPLSYADRPPYADIVEEYGSRVLGDSFVSMRGFMDRERYYEILSSCRYVIFPHHRQQAGAVLRSMVYAGATVFLFKDNPFWDFYTDLGIKLAPLEDFLRKPDLQSFRISDEEAARNRILIAQHFSTELVVKRARVMFETILAEGTLNQ